MYKIDLRWSLQWRHNERHGVTNHQQLESLFNYLFKLARKKILKSTLPAYVMGIDQSPVVKGR